jgi:hypothetical protein
MKRKMIVPLVLLVAAIAAAPLIVHGRDAYVSDFRATYPNSLVKLQSCTLCHTSVPNLNIFGGAFAANLGSSPQAAFRAIESMDSDGDGSTNGEEINGGSFPGDFGDTPSSSGFPPGIPGDGNITLNLSPGGNISIPAYSGNGFNITCTGPASGSPTVPGTPSTTADNAALCITCHRDGRSGSTPSGHPDIAELSQILLTASGGATPTTNSAICAQCHGSGRSGTIPSDHEDISGGNAGGGGNGDDDDDD